MPTFEPLCMPIAVLTETTMVPATLARQLARALGSLVRSTLALEGRKTGEIAVLLADDDLLRRLNRGYRKIDRATDVLSFPYPAPGRRPVDGDLVISMPRTLEQARRYRVRPGRELARLVVHGTLHLAGHDHHLAGERRLMRARERAALAAGREAIAALDAALARRFAKNPRLRAGMV